MNYCSEHPHAGCAVQDVAMSLWSRGYGRLAVPYAGVIVSSLEITPFGRTGDLRTPSVRYVPRIIKGFLKTEDEEDDPDQ
jgi:hypothetical protein